MSNNSNTDIKTNNTIIALAVRHQTISPDMISDGICEVLTEDSGADVC